MTPTIAHRGQLALPTSVDAWEAILAEVISVGLSPRERQVCARRLLGYSESEIARDLFLSVGTIKVYDTNVLQKLQIESVRQVPLVCFQKLWEHHHAGSERPQLNDEVPSTDR